MDPAGLLLSAEPAATRLLARHPAMRLVRGVLRPRRRQEEAALLTALAGLEVGQRCMVALRTRQGAPVLLIRLWAKEAGVVRAYLTDLLAPPPPDTAALIEAFGLTRMEARVAALLSTGLDVAEMAERLGLREGTVRSHLKGAMGKTGCRTQTRLALMVLRAVG